MSSLITGGIAVRAGPARLLDLIAVEALGTSEPFGRDLSVLVPLVVFLSVLADEVFLMILAQVIAAVVHPVKGIRVPPALGVVAKVTDLLVGRRMDVLPVPVQIGLALERLGVTGREEASVPFRLTCRCRLRARTVYRTNQHTSRSVMPE